MRSMNPSRILWALFLTISTSQVSQTFTLFEDGPTNPESPIYRPSDNYGHFKEGRQMTNSIKGKPQNSRWGRSAPGSELIQQHQTKSGDTSPSWLWPGSTQPNPGESRLTNSRPSRATEAETAAPRTSSSRRATWSTAPPTATDPGDEDVYVPFAGQRFDSFDWRLCREMNALAPSNAAVSPVGVKLVLGMLNEAASRSAAAELMRALSLPMGRAAARETFRHILDTMQEDSDGYVMKVGNRIYLDKTFKPLQNISNIFDSYYSAPIIRVNFEHLLAVKQSINSWVSNFTNGQIPTLIQHEHELDRVISIILNVIYFKGEWLYTFPKEDNKEGNFYVTPNKTVKVDYMRIQKDLYFAESEELDAKILRLPYKGKKYSMFLVLPNQKGNFHKMLEQISPKQVRKLLNDLSVSNVKVTLPKFKFDFSIQLKEILQKVGITKIFEKSDEINLVTVKRNIGISKIIQKIGFEVNEEGTEASSVVGVVLGNKWGGSRSFQATHPFLFFIEEEKTGTVAFIGKVINPAHDKPELYLLSPDGDGKSFRSILERDFSEDITQQKIEDVPITLDSYV